MYPCNLPLPPCLSSAIKLPPLNINPILPHRHPQILHRQHRPILTAPLPPPSIPGPLNPQCATPALAPRLLPSSRSDTRRLPRHRKARCSTEISHRVVRVVAGRGADARVLVRVGGDVGDEFLGCEREEPRQSRVGGGGWGEPGFGEVVVCYGVGDLEVWVREVEVGEGGE